MVCYVFYLNLEIRSMKTKICDFEFFADLYKHPSAMFFRAIELKSIHSLLSDQNFSQPSVDLGCGDGAIASLIFDASFTYGVDNGEAKDVQLAINSGRYKKVFIESAENMSLPDESVNFVFSNCVIEHIPNNRAVLSEVSRILKPGGSFVFTVPSDKFPDFLFLTNHLAAIGLASLSRHYKYRRNKMLNQFHCYSVEDWQQKLSEHQLSIENSSYYMEKSALMLWDKMALKIFLKRLFFINGENIEFKNNEVEIRRLIAVDNPKKGEGAGVIIHCKKSLN